MTVHTSVGRYRQTATLSNPGTPSSNGDGDFTVTYTALSPATWRCSIERATVASAERNFSQTVISQSTIIMRGRFHSGITTATRVQWTDRAGVVHTGNVIDVNDSEGAGVETVAAVAEIIS